MNLSQKPWFLRLWTLQEVVVARDPWFLCGEFSCNLSGLLRVFYITQLQGQECTTGMTNAELLWICRSRFYSDSGLHLSELLRKVSNSGYECTKPHDRVYALLALQEPRNLCNIEVNYEKTIQEVFIDTARAVILSTRSLDILHRRRLSYLESLPSWVQDWAREGFDEPINDVRMEFACSKGLRHTFEESSHDCLVVRGKVVTSVAKVASHRLREYLDQYDQGDIEAYLGGSIPASQLLRALEDSWFDGNSPSENRHDDRNWRIAMVFTAGRFHDQEPARFNPDRTENNPNLPNIIIAQGPSCVRSTRKCSVRKVAMLESRNFPMGLVPDFTRRGDLIGIINGSITLFVLRAKGESFEFIGECYVQGIMYGEAVDWCEREGDRFVLE